MTANVQADPTVKPTSRRAVLAGAIGGIGALVATAIGRPSVVQAEGEVIHVGDEITTATTVTRIQNSANNGPVIEGQSTSGTGIYGLSSSGSGVRGISTSGAAIWATSSVATGCFAQSTSGIGMYGTSGSSYAVYGKTNSGVVAATVGHGAGNSTGVQGYSGSAALVPPKPKTGVYGYADQDGSARGVIGATTSGHGVHGIATSGWAGYFAGRVYTSKYHEMKEVSPPAAPAANRGRIFMRNNASGKTQLCVRFSSGAIQILATQP